MGDPRKPKKKYAAPRNPWRSDRISQELYLLGTYGLRNKRELWIAQTELSRIRTQARELLVAPTDIRNVQEKRLLESLRRVGLIGIEATLDDVLGLTVENFLERRLQTVVVKKGIARSPYQARQMITHGHVEVGERIITIPSYIVKAAEDAAVRIRDDSSLAKTAATPAAA
ncbi:MAG: 30S ribosomal protein S4 [Thaumarchaeota archaeon]|nr:30S ribosomal protein S4 [Nitrososphaerota archaeon]